MNKISYPLKSQMKGAKIGDLQQALIALGFEISAKEQKELRFGVATRKSVLAFQKKHGLEPSGVVDQKTAARINRELKGRQRPPASDFVVKGRVMTADDSLAGALVRAVDQDQRGENPLGDAFTDQDGNYQIIYSESQFRRTEKEIGGPDLIVRVYSAEGNLMAQSKRKRNAGGEETVNLTVVSSEQPFIVSGTVRRGDGRPAAGALVRAYDQDLRKKQRLGKATTDASGHYSIAYTSGKFLRAEKASADLRVVVMDSKGKELVSSELLFNTQSEADVDLTLPLDEQTLSEFELLLKDILPLLAGQGKAGADLKIPELEEKDIAFLSQETGQPQERIALLVAAAKALLATSFISATMNESHSKKSKRPAIPMEAFYGWFRQSLPTSLPELLGQEMQGLREALERSARDNIIPLLSGRELDDIINKLQALKADLMLKPADEHQPPSLGDLLKTTRLSPDKQRGIAELQVEHGGASEVFWKALNEREEFNKKEIRALRLTLQLGALTGNHLPLILELQRAAPSDRVGARAKSVLSSDAGPQPELAIAEFHAHELRPFAQLDVNDWKDILLRRQADGEPIGAPPTTPGADLTEKIDNYAIALNQYIENLLPTTVIAKRLEKDTADDSPFKSVQTDLKIFFDNNPSFEFGATPVELYLREGRDQKLSNVTDPVELLVQLKNLDRVYKITPRYPEMRALLSDDLHSALAMVHIGERRFTEKYAEPLGGPNKALEIYRRAEQVHGTALNVYMKYDIGFNSPSPYVIAGDTTRRMTLPPHGSDGDSTGGMARRSLISANTLGWRTQFGSLDLCDCEHCSSLYSPAAYLVDILKFLNDGPIKDDLSPLQALLTRRPDLEHIELTCENTDTQLPYVDLVNELLEAEISPRIFEIAEGPDINTVLGDLKAGKVPATFETALKNKGYPLTDRASVRIDKTAGVESASKWMLLDSGWAFELKHQGTNEGFRVSAWPQTSWTSDELRANPEHVHDPAYAVLRGAVYPWNLPLNLPLEEMRIYLGHLDVNRYEVMEIFFQGTPSEALSDKNIAKEYLGLMKEETDIMTGVTTGAPAGMTSTTGPWNFWDLRETGNDIVDLTDGTAPHAQGDWDVVLQRVSIFLQQSGLNYQELLELLGTYFINPATAGGRIIGIVSTDLEDPATCHLSKLEIQILVENTLLTKKNELIAAWSRIHRFVRLWRKLGWTMRDLDKALAALQPKNGDGNLDITEDFLVQISHIQRLRKDLNVPLVNMLSWWAKIDTAGYIDHLTEEQPEVASLYKQLFRNKTVIKPLDEAFTEDASELSGKISDHLPTLVAALGISAADLSLLTTATAGVVTDDNLNLTNLSQLYRVASFAKALKLSIQQYLSIQKLSGTNPFTAIPGVGAQPAISATAVTVLFAERVKTLRASGFSIDELDYLLRYDFGTPSVVAPAADVLAETLDEIRGELQKIAAENTFHDDPSDPQGMTADLNGELNRKKLALLNWDTALIEQVVATLNGSVAYEALTDTFLAGLILPNDSGTYEVDLASLPAGFTIPGELTSVVTVVPKFLFACDSGIPIESTTAGIISTALNQKFSEKLINLSTPVTVTVETPDTTWTIKGRYSVVKNGGILSVHDLDDSKLRASRLLSKPERDLLLNLAVSSNDIGLIDATENLFDLQDQLQGHITYEQVAVNGQPKGRLRFAGLMTNARKTLLDSVSVVQAYLDAVQALYDAPRKFIARYARNFSIEDFATDLAALPTSVKFPNALKSKVYFDAAAEPKKLHFIGVMTDQQRDALLGLSTNPADPGHTLYVTAVNSLFTQPDALAGTFLTAPGSGSDAAILFDNPTAPAERFLLVLKKLLPYLRQALSEHLVVQKLAEALKSEAKTASNLLTKWVNSPTHPTQKSITEFLAPVFAESNLNAKLTAAAFPDQFKTLTLLHKIAMIVIKFKITPGQLDWLFDNGPSRGWLDLNTLPVTPIAAQVSAEALFAGWERLVDLFRLRDTLPLGELGLFNLFDLALAAAPSNLNAVRNAAKQSYLENISQRTLWAIEELETLLGSRNEHRDKGYLDFVFPDDYTDERKLLQLRECFKLMKLLGGSAAQLSEWGKANQTSAEELDNAASIKNAVKAKYDDKQWLELAKPLKDPLREKQRTALVAYLVTHPDPAKGQNWRDVNELYEYFLIDVEMDPCMMTTRIKQAINSVQLFIQRCLMNLESDVSLTPKDAQEYVLARKWIGVWEANRKVLFYPENWIEPELRDDKSPFFKDLENDLLQDDVTMDTAETAFLHYLEKLNEVARLEIVGLYHQREPATDNTGAGVDILHVFGRTFATPHIYYYRRRTDSPSWMAWEKLEVDIQGNHLIPLIWNRRLYLFWATFTKKQKDLPLTMPEAGKEMNVGKRTWEIQLAWSEYKNGKWSPKKQSKPYLSESNHPDVATDKMDESEFSFKSRVVSDLLGDQQLFLDCYGPVVLASPAASSPLTKERLLFSLNKQSPPIKGKENAADAASVLLKLNGNQLPATAVNNVEFVVRRNPNGNELDRLPAGNGWTDLINGDLPRAKKDYFLSSAVYEVVTITKENSKRKIRQVLADGDDSFVEVEKLEDAYTVNLKPSTSSSVPSINVVHLVSFPFDDSQGNISRPLIVSNPTTTLAPLAGTRFVNMMMVEAEGQNLSNALGNGDNRLLKRTPGAFRLLSPHQTYVPTYLSLPFFYQDELRTYLVSFIPATDGQSTHKYRFSAFRHPTVRAFTKSLNRLGISGLLTLANQRLVDIPVAFDEYQPTPLVDSRLPREDVDFSHAGAYSIYNWELFFHVPFLIATQLSKNQRFEEAQKWFHYILDPTATDSPDRPNDPGPERFWRVKPFYDEAIRGVQTLDRLIADTEEMNEQISHWQANPFKPHVIARLRVVAYMKAVVMRYIDNLIEWGDQLFRRDTIESLNEATQLYILAAQILGKRPENIPPRAIAKNQTFHTLEDETEKGELNSLSNAVVEIESFLPPSVAPTPTAGTKGGKLLMPFFCIPGNDKLLGYWDTVSDRLFKIRHCMNIEGVERSLPMFEPPIDPALLVRAAAAGVDIASALADINAPLPHYRFNVMVQKATELCNDIKSLGSSLLSALEKRDAEALALLRSTHAIKLLNAVRMLKQKQVEEANETLDSLEKGKELTTLRRDYYRDIAFLNEWETVNAALAASALILQTTEAAALGLAGGLHLVPNIKIGAPPSLGATYGGENVGQSAEVFGLSLGKVAALLNGGASMAATIGSHHRRFDDWKLQEQLANKELEQIGKQIVAANIRMAIAERDLSNHDLQIEEAKEVDVYLHDKFTNRQLYDWMVGQISSIYFQSYQLAYDVAKRAERTYRYELGLRDSNFIQFGYWDSLKKGLLSGERLHHDLKRMDVAFLDQNKREYEITKHISLITIDPISFLKLKETGECFVNLPEALFDLDYPGHYMRRVKSVSMTIPCVTGPYAGVNCTLTQLSSSIRHANTLLAGKYSRKGDDTRFSDSFGTIQSIVTSSGQNDSGLFEANLRDERYLPFEGQGAISAWRIQLPTQFKSFDYDTISDVVLHLRYTARNGGELLREHSVADLSTAVNTFMQTDGQPGLTRIFSLRHEFPTEWHRFLNPAASTATDQTLTMALIKERFPFLFQDRILTINTIELLVKIKPEFSVSHNDSTLKLSLQAGAAASTNPLALSTWNELLRTAESPGGSLGDWTLTAWLDTGVGMHERLDPNAIQDILLVCRYTCS